MLFSGGISAKMVNVVQFKMIFMEKCGHSSSMFKCALCKPCSDSSGCDLSAPGLSQNRALFSRGITPIPGALHAQLPPQASLGRTQSPKTHRECGKHSQGKELRLYQQSNLSWQRLLLGRRAARRGTMSLPVTFGRAAHAPWPLMDTRERCLMIFLSCSTSTGLQPMTTFPPRRRRVGRAAAPAPARPAASLRRNSCPASVPATSQRNQSVPPAALLRTATLSRRAGSSCKA